MVIYVHSRTFVFPEQMNINNGLQPPAEVFSCEGIFPLVHQGNIDRIHFFTRYSKSAFGRILVQSDKQVCLFQITQVVFCRMLRLESESLL